MPYFSDYNYRRPSSSAYDYDPSGRLPPLPPLGRGLPRQTMPSSLMSSSSSSSSVRLPSIDYVYSAMRRDVGHPLGQSDHDLSLPPLGTPPLPPLNPVRPARRRTPTSYDWQRHSSTNDLSADWSDELPSPSLSTATGYTYSSTYPRTPELEPLQEESIAGPSSELDSFGQLAEPSTSARRLCAKEGCPNPKVWTKYCNDHKTTSKRNDYVFQCALCEDTFTRRHDRDRHENTHLGAHRFTCEFCQRGFQRQDVRDRHGLSCALQCP